MNEKIPTVGRGLLSRFLGRLKFSQLFLLTAGLFVLDLFVLDPVPFIDETLLLLLTLLFGSWRQERGLPEDEPGDQKPPTKNVTPP